MSGPVINRLINSGGGGGGVSDIVAWVNFDGTGTPAINDGRNVASIGDIDVGVWSITFENALPNADYGIFTPDVELSGVAVSIMYGPASKTVNGFTIAARSTSTQARVDLTSVDVLVLQT
jgi:hypothetical protein